MPASAKQVIQEMYDSFSRGEVSAVLSAYDEQMRWEAAENSPYGDRSPYVGAEQILNGVFVRLLEDWDGFTVGVEELIDVEDRVVAVGRYRGAHRATGQPINAQFAHVWTVKNGKVTRFQQYTDTLQLARAAGSPTVSQPTPSVA